MNIKRYMDEILTMSDFDFILDDEKYEYYKKVTLNGYTNGEKFSDFVNCCNAISLDYYQMHFVYIVIAICIYELRKTFPFADYCGLHLHYTDLGFTKDNKRMYPLKNRKVYRGISNYMKLKKEYSALTTIFTVY